MYRFSDLLVNLLVLTLLCVFRSRFQKWHRNHLDLLLLHCQHRWSLCPFLSLKALFHHVLFIDDQLVVDIVSLNIDQLIVLLLSSTLEQLIHLSERLMKRISQVESQGGHRDTIAFGCDRGHSTTTVNDFWLINVYKAVLLCLGEKLILERFVSLLDLLEFAQLCPDILRGVDGAGTSWLRILFLIAIPRGQLLIFLLRICHVIAVFKCLWIDKAKLNLIDCSLFWTIYCNCSRRAALHQWRILGLLEKGAELGGILCHGANHYHVLIIATICTSTGCWAELKLVLAGFCGLDACTDVSHWFACTAHRLNFYFQDLLLIMLCLMPIAKNRLIQAL